MAKAKKTDKQSGKAELALLIAVALAAGAAGVLSELHANTTVTNNSAKSMQVSATSATGWISENGDGTALVWTSSSKGNQFASAVDWASTSYSLSVDIRPGASGKGAGSGTGSGTANGVLIDLNTGDETPVRIGLSLAVANASDEVFAFNNHTIDVFTDPVSGQSSAFRVVEAGNAAWGGQVGWIAVSVDGSAFDSEAGGGGQVRTFTSRSVVKLK